MPVGVRIISGLYDAIDGLTILAESKLLQADVIFTEGFATVECKEDPQFRSFFCAELRAGSLTTCIRQQKWHV